jgi:UDP-N-acetylmuramate--alanine ligase
MAPKHYFLSGIGGSGMLPLALILKGQGHRVSGSDRGRDQGRDLKKFQDLENKGIQLFPQDGSGVRDVDALVVSAAVENTVPDVKAALEAGIPIIKRAELLAEIFNAFPNRIAVGGTSGKTTVTGMIGYILKECGYDPVLMCGGGLKNYGASALTGKGDVFVTECDESDGTIALYNPDVAVLTNISVDHKSIEELRVLFGDFVNKSRVVVVNADNAEANKIIQNPHPNPLPQAGEGGILTFGFGDAAVTARDIFYMDEGASAIIQMGGKRAAISLEVPGAHNLSNALAAIAAVTACGVPLAAACDKLNRFTGIKRRMEWVGEAHGITVMDDFAHNPDKIAAT